jgi:hypothetical protein
MVVGGAFVSSVLCHLAFPDGYWFTKMWVGVTVGGAVGALGGVLWCRREALRCNEQVSKLLRRVTLSICALAVFGMVVFVPMLMTEKEVLRWLRALSPERVSQVVIGASDHAKPRKLRPAEVEHMVGLLKNAELFTPNHEPHGTEVPLSVETHGEQAREFGVGLPTRHVDDVVFVFRAGLVIRQIRIPRGRVWFQRVVDAE